jgi:hypothetical protein
MDNEKLQEWNKYAAFIEARIEDIKSRAELEIDSLKIEFKMAEKDWWGEENPQINQ